MMQNVLDNNIKGSWKQLEKLDLKQYFWSTDLFREFLFVTEKKDQTR